MRTMEGIVTLVQESRFQLSDDLGISHLFVLAHGAAAEPSQLVALQNKQARVRVHYKAAAKQIANVAYTIEVYAPMLEAEGRS